MTDSLAKLEPYLLLARSTKGAAAAKIILDVTAAPGIYVFSELMELSNIQELSNDPKYQGHYQLLRLFAYGTLVEYQTASSSYPPLTAPHQVKLKHLTLVSLALKNRSLPYGLILSTLQIESIRQLEDLIIDVIYAGLLGGKIHHQEKVLHVDWVAGRDLEQKDLLEVQSGLLNWCKTAETLLSALDDQIQTVRQNSAKESAKQAEYKIYRDREYQSISNELKASKFKSFGSGGGQGISTRHGGIGGGIGKDFSGMGGQMTNEALLAAVAGAGAGGGSGVGPRTNGRLTTRNVSSPDELATQRSSKRLRD
ncbi:uncharacterized protein IL334_007325 [Kwoniella shivajii]|uniref:PCI domain-containing protein n=1 Tax=Kwoniella shivajii TaxID=564305 RepID=A0ABZ1D8C6_9TREE|nr:hypothetical protein IL334_007325 [Kwoniella shivajii]